MLGATAVALLGGGAGAVAATRGSAGGSRQAYIADVAKHLNVSPGALGAAIKAADIDRIEAALAAGRLTQPQADALKQRVQRGSTPVFAPRLGGRGNRGGLAAAAQYLGLDRAALRRERRSGKSLAQIASSTTGRSVQGLEAAIAAAEKARLARALSAGRMTPQQEQKRLSSLSSRVEAVVQRTSAAGPHGPARSRSH